MHVVDIAAYDIFIRHKIIYLFIRNTCSIYQDTTYLHSAKRRMRYDLETMVTYCCKLHVEA